MTEKQEPPQYVIIYRTAQDIYTLGELCVECDDNGKYCYWQDLAGLAAKVSGLIARIETAHELHAVFTIKESKEFAEVKHMLSEVFKTKGS